MRDPVFRGVVGQLRELADELNIRNPQALLREATRRGVGRSLEAARAALDIDAAKQVLAPRQRAAGKSAAEKPNEGLQADLIDFGRNASAESGNKFALVVTDVFTREVETRPLQTKTPQEVGIAVASAVRDLAGTKDVVLSTDGGFEFRGVERSLTEGAVHRVKDKNDRNALAVVDRAIQTLKKDLATSAARDGGDWDTGLQKAESAYNNRYHSVVHGAPAEVEKNPQQEFRVLQDNASKFEYNKALQKRRERDLNEAGAFRAPVPDGGRGFNPRYGPVQKLGAVQEGGLYVTNREGTPFLLKQIQPVDRDSVSAAARLTDPRLGRRVSLRHLTNGLVQYLTRKGEVHLEDLQRDVNAGSHNLLSLKRGLDRAKLRLLSFLQLFDDLFVVRSGRVRLKTLEPSPAPPAPGRRLTLLGDDAAGAVVMDEMRRIQEEERASSSDAPRSASRYFPGVPLSAMEKRRWTNTRRGLDLSEFMQRLSRRR